MILKYILGGLICGCLYGLTQCFVLFFKKHIVAQILFDLLFSFASGIIYLYITMVLNLGSFRFYLTAIFLISFVFQRKTIGKLFAKLYTLVYNWLCKTIKVAKTTKLGKVVFK